MTRRNLWRLADNMFIVTNIILGVTWTRGFDYGVEVGIDAMAIEVFCSNLLVFNNEIIASISPNNNLYRNITWYLNKILNKKISKKDWIKLKLQKIGYQNFFCLLELHLKNSIPLFHFAQKRRFDERDRCQFLGDIPQLVFNSRVYQYISK